MATDVATQTNAITTASEGHGARGAGPETIDESGWSDATRLGRSQSSARIVHDPEGATGAWRQGFSGNQFA